MARILVLFAHPAVRQSRVHRRMLGAVPVSDDVTLHDLYESYPDLLIDVRREQQLLLDHDIIVLQFPFYWYSTPPILKQWFDLVLEHGWAYGSQGKALEGKTMVCALSAGGGDAAYRPDGYNRYTIPQFLAPVERTAILCRMRWLPPWVVPGTHRLSIEEIERAADDYGQLLRWLAADGASGLDLSAAEHLNAQIPNGASVATDGGEPT